MPKFKVLMQKTETYSITFEAPNEDIARKMATFNPWETFAKNFNPVNSPVIGSATFGLKEFVGEVE